MKASFHPLSMAAGVMALAAAAQADVAVRFAEGVPKDRFDITNTGACDLGPVTVTVDLTGSSAGLVFGGDAQAMVALDSCTF